MNNKHLSEEIIVKFLDNELTDEEKEEVEFHLSKCEYCKNILNDYLYADNIISNYKVPEVILPELAIDSYRSEHLGWYKYLQAAAIILIILGSFVIGMWSGYEYLNIRDSNTIAERDEFNEMMILYATEDRINLPYTH